MYSIGAHSKRVCEDWRVLYCFVLKVLMHLLILAAGWMTAIFILRRPANAPVLNHRQSGEVVFPQRDCRHVGRTRRVARRRAP